MNPQNLSERELLEELVKTQRKSATFAKIAAIAACTFAALLLVAVVIIVPRFLQAADQVVQTANNVTKTIEQVNESVATLTTLSDESGDILEKVNGLIDSSSETIEGLSGLPEAIEHLNKIDIDSFNKTIENLADVTEKLCTISGFIGGAGKIIP